MACYVLGQVDKWNLLKEWILLEQQKDKLEDQLEVMNEALNKLENKKVNARR